MGFEPHRMIEHQIEHPNDRRVPVTDPRVLDAMRRILRHEFVPEQLRIHAYEDRPLAIGHSQTISQPYMVAFMTARLDVQPHHRVLEIGTGSGYQTAVLAELAARVFSIEVVDELAGRARETLTRLGYENVDFRTGNGAEGWPEAAPFDRILAACAAPEGVPHALFDQLAPGGKALIPVGEVFDRQDLLEVLKRADGTRVDIPLMGVRFVPMTEGRGGEMDLGP